MKELLPPPTQVVSEVWVASSPLFSANRTLVREIGKYIYSLKREERK